MAERSGLTGNEFDGVFFSELLAPPGTSQLGTVLVTINRQNANLLEVKSRMAADAKRMGANAIVGFKYGQRSHKWWQLIFTFKWDSEGWFGEGTAVRLDG